MPDIWNAQFNVSSVAEKPVSEDERTVIGFLRDVEAVESRRNVPN